jgi:hypothetical protein
MYLQDLLPGYAISCMIIMLLSFSILQLQKLAKIIFEIWIMINILKGLFKLCQGIREMTGHLAVTKFLTSRGLKYLESSGEFQLIEW